MAFLPIFPLEISPLTSLSLFLLLGSIGGFIAHKSSFLPSITGFMAVGLLCGPQGLNIITYDTLSSIKLLIDICLGLILYRLGISLDITKQITHPKLFIISYIESTFTFICVFFVLIFFDISYLVSALIATIVISSSPAVLLHVAAEEGAEGKFTENAKRLVALNNLLAFLAFTFVLPAVHFSLDASWDMIILQPLYRLAGSLAVGLSVAYALHYLVHKTESASQYRLALVIGAIMMTLGLSQMLNLSTLFAPLILGIAIRSLEEKPILSAVEFDATFELFFIVLFVFAGANLHLNELIEYAPAIFALVFMRTFAKIAATTVTYRIYKKPFKTGFASSLLLVPMAGLAIGLAQTTSDLFPLHAATVSAIVLGAVAVFETIGPPLATQAFHMSKETKKDRDAAKIAAALNSEAKKEADKKTAEQEAGELELVGLEATEANQQKHI
jgi:Kef-type K+ transport system membrane component KefB